MQYVNINRLYTAEKETAISINNRAFRYGDALFETIRVVRNRVLLWELHLERLTASCALLKYNLHGAENDLESLILETVKKNGLENARIKLTIFRNDGGLYEPDNNNANFLIEASHLDAGYPLNETGLTLGLYEALGKPLNWLSNLKTCNALIFVIATLHKKHLGLDDCLIVNTEGRIAEASSSNIFIVKNKSLITPPLSEGCLNGVMRTHIIQLAKRNGIPVFEKAVTINDLSGCDELFLTSAIRGIRWAGKYGSKEYKNDMAKRLSAELEKSVA
ncbi:MAG: aminotransferase class IV [Bacteroidota bacterium]|nr:aminotransferase class IV [Bacteroidota bacterium]